MHEEIVHGSSETLTIFYYVIVCVFLCTHCTYVTYCNPYVWSGVWADNLPTCAWNRQTPRATTPSPRSSAEHDLLIYDALAPI